MINLAKRKWQAPVDHVLGTRITLQGVDYSHCKNCQELIDDAVEGINKKAHEITHSRKVPKRLTIEPLSAYKYG